MDQVDQIKRKLSIVDIVGEYVELKKSGRNYKALCPFHGEKTPSFMVSPELQIYKCFGCGESGDMFSFVEKTEGIEFPQALEKLAERAGIELEKTHSDPDKGRRQVVYEINHLTAEYYHFVLTKHKVGKNALDYLTKERKFTANTIESFKLGYAPDSWDGLFSFLAKRKYSVSDILASGVVVAKKSGDGYLDKFKGRIIFPFTGIDGNVVGFSGRTVFDREPKYINTSETLVFHKSSFLYGLDKAKVGIRKKGAVFVEGPTDVISSYQAGVDNVVATSGTALTTGHLKIISRFTKDITFCFDSDSAGFSAVDRAIELAEKEDFNLRVAIIPEKYKDLDEFIKSGPKDLFSFFDGAVSVYDFFLTLVLKRYNKNDPIGKKKIVQELVPIYSRITDPVTLNHYTKRLSEAVSIDQTTVTNLLKGKAVSGFDTREEQIEDKGSDSEETKGKSPGEYILALLMKAPLDISQTVLYKLAQKDFADPKLAEVFSVLKEHLIDRKKKLEIKHFSNKFGDELKGLIEDLYLWDMGDLAADPVLLQSEIDTAFARLKQATIKRELKELSARIKDAEISKDVELLDELSRKFKDLSQKLI